MTSHDFEAPNVLRLDRSDGVEFADGAFEVDSRSYQTLLVQGRVERGEWWDRQLTSVESYKEQHEGGHIHPQKLSIYRLFGAYIGAALRGAAAPTPLILDVGCGIFPEPPPYISSLQGPFHYAGLDPLPMNAERAYPFICARLEDIADLEGFKPKFDLFVFATSLDHFESLEDISGAVRNLAAPGAQAVFWNGLYDAPLIAADHGARVFERVLVYPPPVGFAAFFAYGLFRLPRLLIKTWTRRRKLARGQPLDDSHYRYFTEANVRDHLSSFGVVEDILNLPNIRDSFARVRVSAPPPS